jgi:hypothetical protein
MFPSLRTSPLAQRALGALDLARSFLLLEDDYAVDWEVDRDEPSPPIHPHRAPLRRRSTPRRPGGGLQVEHVCVSPIFNGEPARRGPSNLAGTIRAPREGIAPARRGSHPGGNELTARPDTRVEGLRPPGCGSHRDPA